MTATQPADPVPVMSEATEREWRAPDGTRLLDFDSRDRSPYFIPRRFHTLASLKQLAAAIQEAIERAER